jgi:undecaprenyl diphosphate synthase
MNLGLGLDCPAINHSSDLSRLPRHIAIIMDGNRRWAAQRGLPPFVGHWKGAEALTRIVSAAAKIGIKILTVYAFSTENWNRPPEEVRALMDLFKNSLLKQRDLMIEKGVKLDTIGDLSRLPQEVQELLEETKKMTSQCTHIELVLALGYGGRDDIRRAAIAITKDCIEQKLSKESLSEEMFSTYLDTAKWQDPDLLIRTSGQMRLSNFLLWQISYSEVYITDILWPDFDENELLKAIADYQRREEHRPRGL